jgi:hypothetical protein
VRFDVSGGSWIEVQWFDGRFLPSSIGALAEATDLLIALDTTAD